MLRSFATVLAALALTLTACGYEEPVPEASPLLPGDATLERMELSLGESAEVELFFAAPAGCPVVPATFAAKLNGQALAVQEPGHFGWVMRPACAAGEQGPECEGTTLTLGCEAPRASATLKLDAALVDGPLELQVGDTRFSYPVALSTLAWHVVPAADGTQKLTWGGPMAPTATKVQHTNRNEQALTSSQSEMVLPTASQVAMVTTVVVSAPGAPSINVTVRQMVAMP